MSCLPAAHRSQVPLRARSAARLGTILCALVVGAACTRERAEPSGWELLGEHVDGGEITLASHLPAIAMDPTVDRPVVVLHEEVDNVVHVRAWTGSEWRLLDPSFSGRDSGIGVDSTTDIAVAADGTVWLAWIEDDLARDDAQHVYVARWQGSTWTRVGGDLAAFPLLEPRGTANSAWHPSIAVDPDGVPWVAWSESSDRGDRHSIQLKRLDGGTWVAVGAEQRTSDDEDVHVSLHFDAEARPVVVYESTAGGSVTSLVAVDRWSGTTWDRLGALTGGDHGYERAPAAAFAPNGIDLYVSYRGGPAGAYALYVDHWDGSDWVTEGPRPVRGGGEANVGTADIAVGPDGEPIVTWSQQVDGHPEIRAIERNGSSWAELGGEFGGEGGNNYGPVIAVDSAGVPVVAWDDGSQGRHVFASRWVGEE